MFHVMCRVHKIEVKACEDGDGRPFGTESHSGWAGLDLADFLGNSFSSHQDYI